MFKNRPDCKSRFRILKGGKISLVVSALLTSGMISTAVAATDYTVDDNTTQQFIVLSLGDTVTIDGNLSTTDDNALRLGGTIDNINIAINPSGTVSADGTSTFRAISFETDMNASTLRNSGDISANALLFGYGVYLDGDLIDSTITNEAGATISAVTLNEAARSIYFNGNMINSAIVNDGTIVATSDNDVARAIAPSNLTDSNITNNGNITVTSLQNAQGINASTLTNSTITNNGDMNVTSTTSYGYAIRTQALDNSNIINNDTILITATSGDGRAIYTGDLTNSNITNNDIITINANEARGLSIDALFNSHITNNGDMFLTGANGGIGIKTDDVELASTITNTSDGNITLRVASGDAIGIDADQIIEGSIVLNQGLIDVEKTNSDTDAEGIVVEYLNNGTLRNTGEITVTSVGNAYGINIKAEGGINADSLVENTNLISVTSDTIGYGIYSTDDNDGNIVNGSDAQIIVSSSFETYGIYLDYTGNDGNITNAGEITVNTSIIGGATGILSSGGTGIITNSGTVTATKNGEAHYQAVSIYDLGTSTVNNTSSGVLSGNIILGGTLNNAGRINLPYNAYSDNTSASIHTFNNSGILQIGLLTDGDIGNTEYSQLETTNATFEDGSTIHVNILAASTNTDSLIGETLQGVVNSTNLNINGTLNITDNSSLINFEYLAYSDGDGDHIDLNITQGATILDTTIAGGGNTPAVAAATVLDAIQDAGTYADMTPVLNALIVESQNGDAALARAVESTTPQSAGAGFGAATQISSDISDIVEERQNIGIDAGLNSGENVFSEKNLWMKPFGSFGQQNDKDGINGFDINSYGIGLGVDGEYKPKQTLGFAFFFTKANADINNIEQETDLDVYTALIYGSAPLMDEKTKLLYQVGYAWQKSATSRTLFNSDVAIADYTSTIASLDLKAIRNYRINDKLLLQPMLEAAYRHFSSPSYSESGAGALNLQIDKFSATELIAGVGAMAHYKLDDSSKLVGNINIGYDLKDDRQSITSSYEGAAGLKFDTDGIDNGRWSYDLGIGYEKNFSKVSNLNFSYGYQGKGEFSNNTLSLKYVHKF